MFDLTISFPSGNILAKSSENLTFLLLFFLEVVEQNFDFHLLQQLAFLFVVYLKEIFALGLIFCCQNQIHNRIHYFLAEAKVEFIDEEGHCFHHHHCHRSHFYFCY